LRVDDVSGGRVVWAVSEHVVLLLDEIPDLRLDDVNLTLDLVAEANVVDVGLRNLLTVTARLAHELLLVAFGEDSLALVPAVSDLLADALEDPSPIESHGVRCSIPDTVSALLTRFANLWQGGTHGFVWVPFVEGHVGKISTTVGQVTVSAEIQQLGPAHISRELVESSIPVWFLWYHWYLWLLWDLWFLWLRWAVLFAVLAMEEVARLDKVIAELWGSPFEGQSCTTFPLEELEVNLLETCLRNRIDLVNIC